MIQPCEFDTADYDDLMDFVIRTHPNTFNTTRATLFPEQSERDGCRALRMLANMAHLRARAYLCRIDGKIADALRYETEYEALYNTLPDWAKW